MFNKRINARLARLERLEEAYKTHIGSLEKEIKQLKCEHGAVIFKELPIATMSGWNIWISGVSLPQESKTPYAKECAIYGKTLKYYKTKREWLEARLKAEKKTAGKSKKKTAKKAQKKVAS